MNKVQTVYDIKIKIEIELMAEKGQTCAKFVSNMYGINLNKAGNYLRELVRDGVLEKVPGKIKLGETFHQFYRISTDEGSEQRALTVVDVRRDHLVEAFFGPA